MSGRNERPMSPSRRRFLRSSLAVGAAVALPT